MNWVIEPAPLWLTVISVNLKGKKMGQIRKRHYHRYTFEFMKVVVKLASNPSVKAKDIAYTLGHYPVMVCRWQMEYRYGELRGNRPC